MQETGSHENSPHEDRNPNHDIARDALYRSLLLRIDENSRDNAVWQEVVAHARREEVSGGGTESYYTHVPLEELIHFGERIRALESRDTQYEILTERCSTGERWYDIILGHVNDKGFAPIAEELGRRAHNRGRKWEQGLDVGSGTGNALTTIERYFEKITGVDILESVLRHARDENVLHPNVRVVAGDAVQLPFKDNVFDVSVSSGLVYYLSKAQMQRYVEEIARVLKLDGLHFESFLTKEKGDLVPETEKESLTSAKGLVVYLLGNIVSHKAQEYTLKEFLDTFRANGFAYRISLPQEDGVRFVTFQKEDVEYF